MAEAKVVAIKAKSFAGEVWNTLSKIDCSARIEKKQGLTYLSWAWAWGILMENYPESEFDFLPEETRPDGTMQIWVKVTVRQGEQSIMRVMWLPVLDHRNKPIINPDAFQVNTTRMRCLTKCLAMFGLGHYIYAGEDLPTDSPVTEKLIISDEQAAEIKGLLEATNSDVKRFLAAMSPGCQSVDNLPSKTYETAVKALRVKAEKMGIEL